MDKQNVMYTYNGILFNLTPAKTWMNLEDVVLSEIRRSQEDKYCLIPLMCGTWSGQAPRDSTTLVAGAGGRKQGSVVSWGLSGRFAS